MSNYLTSATFPVLSEKPTKSISFKSMKKCFEYWDREAKQKVDVKLPIEFIVAAQTMKMSWFDSQEESGIYSWECHNIQEHPITVKTRKYKEDWTFNDMTLAQGWYMDSIKPVWASRWWKYTAVLHCIDVKTQEYFVVELSGAALSTFIQLSNIQKKWALRIAKTEEKKNWAVKYSVPVWEEWNLDNDTYQIACELSEKLEEHWTKIHEYFKSKKLLLNQDEIEKKEENERKLKETWEKLASWELQPDPVWWYTNDEQEALDAMWE
jgi:hypothetical protein